MAESYNILGIDYGGKRVGLALADVSAPLAIPYEIVANENDNQVIEYLGKLMLEQNVQLIVLGMPVFMKDKYPEQFAIVQSFKNKLEKTLSYPVEVEDESFSTGMAEKMGGKGDDAQAAAVILQSYLDRKK